MSNDRKRSRVPHVLMAAGAIVLLAGVLGVRLLAADGKTAPPDAPAAVGAPPAPPSPPAALEAVPAPPAPPEPAAVPAPPAVPVEKLAVPCWSCPDSRNWSLDFRTDLDLLAPLGNGKENAARWFAQFNKLDGPRFPEAAAAMKRRVDHPSGLSVLPPDDPLLLEAEPWIDQATMTFYPEVITPNGLQTAVPNLLLMLTMAKSWVARGHDAMDDDDAMEDYRRAIRLGRLMRQEDVTIIADLVGLACIRLGADAIADRARRAGDLGLALLASIVSGEIAPQRLLTSEKILTDPTVYLRKNWFGKLELNMSETEVQDALDRARNAPDRRIRLEAMITLNLVRHLGDDEQKAKALDFLNEMIESDDPVVSETARWCRDTVPTADSWWVD